MSWNDTTSSVSDPSNLNSFYYARINSMYTEVYAYAEGNYNLYRVTPDGDRLWKDYWVANNPGGLDLLDSTSDIYDEIELLLDEADDILALVNASMPRYLGEEHYTDSGDDPTIELMSKGRYLKFRLDYIDVTGFDYTEVEEYYPNMDATSFDQMDHDGDGLLSDSDLIFFLDEPDPAARGASPSSYTPEVTLQTLYAGMVEIRNNIRNIKWRSKLQSI